MKGSKDFFVFLKSKLLAVGAFFTSLPRKWLIAILIGAATVLVTAAALLIILLLPGDEDGCIAHIDTDGDLLCDECGAELKEALGECVTHINRDGDALCDRCGKPIESADPEPDPEPDPTPEHRDSNFDGKCDICLDTISDAVLLVQNGKSNFSFVYGQSLDGNAMMTLDMLAASIKRL